jgi:hypothetical protein
VFSVLGKAGSDATATASTKARQVFEVHLMALRRRFHSRHPGRPHGGAGGDAGSAAPVWRGLGYLEVVQFASFTPNIGPFMEFKGNTDLPVGCDSSSLKCKDGQVQCPTGVGFGVTIDAEFVKRSQPV